MYTPVFHGLDLALVQGNSGYLYEASETRKMLRAFAHSQVSAHGTGASIPPVDEQVVRLRLVTPAMGSLELSSSQSPRLFRLAKVGLGLLGVVSELTLQCVDAHELLEQTYVTTVQVLSLSARVCFRVE